uniref:SMODS and SLOG-associating 2TM effector domain-containing protein n=1 Tax=Cladonia uncialis subsp. uncialis TaxID=180999 RepID=A0A1Z1CEE5_CLAUC|nr:hypothetical protein [Cladonia uncialis subsp. uncialis]AUW31005.1 hypothetical protein [Cladonia uncialis subsp. uncialis]
MRLGSGKQASTATSNPASSDNHDLEKQGAQEETLTVDNPASRFIPQKLAKFQNLIGICSPNVLRPHPALTRPAPNEGIYKRTVDEEAKVGFQYQFSNYVVNISGMAQIVVGAAVTALGAANGPRAAVTIFGAANTIMAGMLTYLKGQGLPYRLEQYLHLLRTLREHIEERERELMEPDCPLDVEEEIKSIIKMYQEVRQSKEDNAPGTVIPPRGNITSLLEKPDIKRSEVPAPLGDKEPGALLATGLQDLASYREYAEATAEHKVAEHTAAEAKSTADADVRSALGAEITHLGDITETTFEQWEGGESSGKKKPTDQGDR